MTETALQAHPVRPGTDGGPTPSESRLVPGVLRLRVVDVVVETADARSIVLARTDGSNLDYRAGQYLTFRVPVGGAFIGRCYSLSSAPTPGTAEVSVTVKRVANGRGSAWMCDELKPGMELDVLRPAGKFVAHDPHADLLLIAGGSGVTPVMSILRAVLEHGSGRVDVLYANRDEESVIFAAVLAELEREYHERLTVHHWLESVQGRPSAGTLAARIRHLRDREIFLCGPGPFMGAVRSVLSDLEIPRDRVHVEDFVSIEGDPFVAPESGLPGHAGESTDEAAAEVEVQLDGEVRTVAWPRDRKLLDVLLAEGIDAPFSCREGGCSACACILLEGEVEMERNDVLDARDLAEGVRLSCQSRPVTDRVRVSYDG